MQKVICVNDCTYSDFITKGKVYDVIDVNAHDGTISIISNRGVRCAFFADRFRYVASEDAYSKDDIIRELKEHINNLPIAITQRQRMIDLISKI